MISLDKRGYRNGRARDCKVDKVTGMGGRFSRFDERGEKTALIKNKIKFSSYIRKFRGIGCKVIYD